MKRGSRCDRGRTQEAGGRKGREGKGREGREGKRRARRQRSRQIRGCMLNAESKARKMKALDLPIVVMVITFSRLIIILQVQRHQISIVSSDQSKSR